MDSTTAVVILVMGAMGIALLAGLGNAHIKAIEKRYECSSINNAYVVDVHNQPLKVSYKGDWYSMQRKVVENNG